MTPKQGEIEMKKSLLTTIITMSLLILLTPFVATASGTESIKPTTLTWTAGGIGGGWYVQAGGISSLIAKKEPNLLIKVIPGGGVVNPVLVSRHKDDLGWGITFVDKMAYKGMAPLYKKPNPDVRSLGGIFGVYDVHFLAAKDTGVKTVGQLADLIKAGKAVKIAAPMNGTSDLPLVEAILRCYGVSLKQIEQNGGKVFHAVYADMVTLYQDRHVDYVCCELSLPASAIIQMTVSRKSTLLSVSDGCIDQLHESLGSASRDSKRSVIPKGTYEGQTTDVPTVSVAGELLINKDVPNLIAYTIIKIICDNIKEIHEVDHASRYFLPETGWKNVVVPLHPGAEKFYKEAGYMK
jgi:TRAP transporter TAXI family solute receptor